MNLTLEPDVIMELADEAGLCISYDYSCDAFNEDQWHFYEDGAIADAKLLRFAELLIRHHSVNRIEAANVRLRDGKCYHKFAPEFLAQADGSYSLYVDNPQRQNTDD